MRKGWDKDMEQEKLYVIEEKTYEAHIAEEDVYKRQPRP